MKKNDYFGDPPSGRWMGMKTKALRSVLLLLFCAIGCAAATPAFPQGDLISVSYTDVSVVEILNDLKKQTGYEFFYKKEAIPGSLKATVTMADASLEEILKKILTVNNLDYKIQSDNVVIAPGSTIQTTDQPPENTKPLVSIQVKVLDKNKKPIPNVSVKIKDKPYGIATNREGVASMLIPAQDKIVVVFSFTGMKKQEVPYTGQKLIQVVMEEDIVDIKEVIVTGYGDISRSDYSGSATVITQEELQKLNTGNILRSLEVFDPSFKLILNNEMGSNPNATSEFFIRGRTGTTSVKELDAMNPDDPYDISQFALESNPSAPIFVLDGFVVSQAKINDLDLNRVQSVTILKDAAATAIYGSRAGNGVVVIQTIPPQPGEVQITYSGKLTATFPDLTSYDLMNAAEALEAERLAGVYNSTYSQGMAYGAIAYQNTLNAVLQGINTDWISKPLRSAYNHRHTVSLTGGSQELRYGLDLSYNMENGVMKGSYRNTAGVALTLDYRWRSIQIKNKIEVGRMNSEESPYGNFGDYVRMKPYLSVYDEFGDYLKRLELSSYAGVFYYITNPLYEANCGNIHETKYTEFLDNLSLVWRSPNSYWTLRGNFGISYKIEDANKFTSPYSANFFTSTNEYDPATIGTLSTSEVRTTEWSTDISLSYARSTGGHSINYRISAEAAENKATSFSAAYRGFANNVASPAQAIEIITKPTYKDSQTRRLSAFLMSNYSYLNIYLLDLSGRLDGSSVFGEEKKIAPFWSVGMGLNVHNYPWMDYYNWLDILKLTATYGQVGKANFQPYQAKTTYVTIYTDHYAYATGMKIMALGNDELKWEKTRTWNFKIELGLLDNAINLQFEYYRIKTIDLVEDVTIPSSSGFTVYKGNIGKVMNKGYEIGTSFRIFRNHDWQISVINQLTHNTNRIVEIGDALEEYNQRIDDFFNPSASSKLDIYATPIMKYEEGGSLSAIYGMKSLGIDPATGNELYVKRDGTVTHVWSSSEQQILGDTEPKMSGSLQFNAKWKQLELYTAFLYQWGGQAYNQTYQEIENVDLKYYSGDRRIITERWKKVGDVTKLKNISQQTYITRPTSRFVQDNDMFRFYSISLIYSVKEDWLRRNLKISSAKITFSMNDIATLSSIPRERGTSYPFARSFNLNLQVRF